MASSSGRQAAAVAGGAMLLAPSGPGTGASAGAAGAVIQPVLITSPLAS